VTRRQHRECFVRSFREPKQKGRPRRRPVESREEAPGGGRLGTVDRAPSPWQRTIPGQFAAKPARARTPEDDFEDDTEFNTRRYQACGS
jgi:hypothetical protein